MHFSGELGELGRWAYCFFKGGTRGGKKIIKRYLSIKEKLLFGKAFCFVLFSLKYNGKLTRYRSLVLPSKMEAQKQGTCHIKCVRPRFSKRMFSQGALQVLQELDLHLFVLPCFLLGHRKGFVFFLFIPLSSSFWFCFSILIFTPILQTPFIFYESLKHSSKWWVYKCM